MMTIKNLTLGLQTVLITYMITCTAQLYRIIIHQLELPLRFSEGEC